MHGREQEKELCTQGNSCEEVQTRKSERLFGKRPLDLDHGMSEGKPRQIRKGSLECRTKELALRSIGTGKQIIQGRAARLAGWLGWG